MAMAVFTGCGNESQLNLGQDSDYFGQDGSKEMGLGSSSFLCDGPFSRTLGQNKNKDTSPGIEFASADRAVEAKALDGNATKQERCDEINKHLAQGALKVELSFLASETEKKQMAQGKVLSMQPRRVNLEYADSSVKGFHNMDLSCNHQFIVSCDIQEIDGKKECLSYVVKPVVQSCKFRAPLLPFGFSDNKNAELDITGEMAFYASGEAEIKFDKITARKI